MTNPTIWNQLLIWPIINILIAFYKVFEFLKAPGPLGFAIISLTVFVRLLLYPVMQKQIRSAQAMARLKPKMDELVKRHEGDKKKIQQAQLALYKEHGINPAAGCLPTIIQFPVLIALYNVFFQLLANGDLAKMVEHINSIVYFPVLKISSLNLSFFGINLGIKPSNWQTEGVWLLSIPVVTAGLQWLQTQLLQAKPKDTVKSIQGETEVKKESPKGASFAEDMQKQMTIFMPVMFGLIALQFPVGLSLYWNIFSIFGIMQQLALKKPNEAKKSY